MLNSEAKEATIVKDNSSNKDSNKRKSQLQMNPEITMK